MASKTKNLETADVGTFYTLYTYLLRISSSIIYALGARSLRTPKAEHSHIFHTNTDITLRVLVTLFLCTRNNIISTHYYNRFIRTLTNSFRCSDSSLFVYDVYLAHTACIHPYTHPYTHKTR